jgi:hypothetical protein
MVRYKLSVVVYQYREILVLYKLIMITPIIAYGHVTLYDPIENDHNKTI